MKYIIGITGPTGGGKSTLAAALGNMGAHVLDADTVARALQQPGMPGALAIQAEFGSAYFNAAGELQRAQLATLVFNDPNQLARLNAVMFPLISEAMSDMLLRLEGIIIIDAAVLFEAGADRLCDITIAATASEAVRLSRIMLRDGLTEAQAQQRMAAQRRHYPADIQIDTTDGLDSTTPQLAAIMSAAEKQVNQDRH